MRTEFLRGQACLFHFHILSFRLLLLRTTPPTSWLSPSLPPPLSSFLSLVPTLFWSVQQSGFLPLWQLCAARQSLAYWLSRTGSSEIPLIKDRDCTRVSQHSATYAQKNTDRMHAVEAELREVNRLWQTETEGNAISLWVKIHWCSKKAVNATADVSETWRNTAVRNVSFKSFWNIKLLISN